MEFGVLWGKKNTQLLYCWLLGMILFVFFVYVVWHTYSEACFTEFNMFPSRNMDLEELYILLHYLTFLDKKLLHKEAAIPLKESCISNGTFWCLFCSSGILPGLQAVKKVLLSYSGLSWFRKAAFEMGYLALGLLSFFWSRIFNSWRNLAKIQLEWKINNFLGCFTKPT